MVATSSWHKTTAQKIYGYMSHPPGTLRCYSTWRAGTPTIGRIYSCRLQCMRKASPVSEDSRAGTSSWPPHHLRRPCRWCYGCCRSARLECLCVFAEAGAPWSPRTSTMLDRPSNLGGFRRMHLVEGYLFQMTADCPSNIFGFIKSQSNNKWVQSISCWDPMQSFF